MSPATHASGAHPAPRRRGGRAAAILLAGVLAGAALAGAPVPGPALPAARADEWRDRQYWLEDYGFTTAWETSRGEGVTVAVIDTGIDAGHPDLTGQVVGGLDVSGVGDPTGTEPVGPMPDHGTMVASVLAGHGNNQAALRRADEQRRRAKESPTPSTLDSGSAAPPGSAAPSGSTAASGSAAPSGSTAASGSAAPSGSAPPGTGPDGILGVAPGVELLSVSVDLGPEDGEGPTAEDQIARAVTWAVDQGADVINMSLGSTRQAWPQSWDRAFLHAEENDVVVVAAAGNRASGTATVGAPATIPGVLTVAGLNADGTASWDSSTEGISIGVAAPADPLVGAVPGGGRTTWSGTSGAAPMVAGLAALIRSAHPEMPAHQVIHRILSTAEDAGVPGVDPVYGHGIIDAAAAVTAEVEAVDRNPMDTLADWIRVHRRAEAPASSAPAASAGPSAPGVEGRDAADPDGGPDPLPTRLPQATAPGKPAPGKPAPGLQPALVLGTAVIALGLAGTAVVVGRRRDRASSSGGTGSEDARPEDPAPEADPGPSL